MNTLYDLPKEMLIQLLINVNDLSKLNDKEFLERQNTIELEKEKRIRSKRFKVIKNSLLQLTSFPHLHDIISQNVETINSLDTLFLYNNEHVFLQSLSNLYIKQGWGTSLFEDIKNYIEDGISHTFWIESIKIHYNLCETCNKKEVSFHYEEDYRDRCIAIDEIDHINYVTDFKYIKNCPNCLKIHCQQHIC